jgi:hypothetical protein
VPQLKNCTLHSADTLIRTEEVLHLINEDNDVEAVDASLASSWTNMEFDDFAPHFEKVKSDSFSVDKTSISTLYDGIKVRFL